MTELTIEQRLLAEGLGHRRDANTERDGKRVVFRIASGEIIGRFEALDALHLLGGELLFKPAIFVRIGAAS